MGLLILKAVPATQQPTDDDRTFELVSRKTKYNRTPRHGKRFREQVEAVIRTGCLSCQAAAAKCDGTLPNCDRASRSEDWRANVAWQWSGTWRERRGMHAFVGLAHSTKIVGLFESAFWHRTLLPACYHVPALFHLASGVGALFETAIQHSTGYGTIDGGRDSFALQQCNRSIGLLTKDRNGALSPEVALAACILFTCLSGLMGEFETAGRHTLQGRGLLNLVTQLEVTGETSGLVRSEAVRPILDNLEVQAKTLQGRNMQITDKEADPPLPDASMLYSLEHAHSTLSHTYARLWVFCQDCPLDLDAQGMCQLQAEKVATYATWYQQWGASFTDLLMRIASDGGLKSDDQKRAQLLKLNFIYGSMMAHIDQGGERSIFDAYEEDFGAIVDLSASVLKTFNFTVQTRSSKARYPYLNFGLWVDEPLFFTMSRCTNPETRRKAAGLLHGLRYRSILKRKNESESSGIAFQEDWTAEQWIEFAGRTRFDYAMARFFGGFPSDFAETPVFDETCA